MENKGKLMLSKYKLTICALRNYNLNSREKFEPGPGFEPRTYRSQQALPCSIDGTGLNFPLESNAMQFFS